jgi:voltage-gated potassium channel
MQDAEGGPHSGWRARIHTVIFEADTRAGKAFDVALMVTIGLSVLAVLLESVVSLRVRYGGWLRAAEWTFTILFTLEYALRLLCVSRPLRYARSFFGLVDLLAIVPTYLSALLPGAQALAVIRALRILRVFRVLKLATYVSEGEELMRALQASRRKIAVFLFTVGSLVVIFGAIMYLVEGPETGFTSIPIGIYWAIVTLTTVGYGDISPQTPLGQAIASCIMVLGYGIIAVPTGIVTAELARGAVGPVSTQACPACGIQGHSSTAAFCMRCGAHL